MDTDLEPPTTGTTTSRFALICVGLGFAVSAVLALLSDGPYHQDALTHYLYARWSWSSPGYLVDEWGRPGLTCLLFPLSALGWTACRIEAAVLSALSAWLAYGVARRLGWRRAAWVPMLVFVQPLFVLASYTTLTETATALYLTLALWCFVTGRRVASAAVVSLCLVTRYETLVLVPLWVMALWRTRSPWRCYPILLWAPVLHNVLGQVVLGRWAVTFMAGSSHASMYGSGTPLSMLIKSMAASGPAVAVLALVGTAVAWRTGATSPVRPGTDDRPVRSDRQAWLLPACYLVHLLTHTVIFWRGMYASGGYPRFLVSTSPLAALCAVAGLNAILDATAHRRRVALAVLALVTVVMCIGVELEAQIVDEAWMFLIEPVRRVVRVLTVVVLLAVAGLWTVRRWLPGGILAAAAVGTTVVPLAYLVRPHRISPDARDLERTVAWLQLSAHAGAPVVATNVWVSCYLDRGYNVVPPDSTTILDWASSGTVFVWDAEYSPTPRFDISLDSMAERRGWRQVWQSRALDDQQPFARVYVRE